MFKKSPVLYLIASLLAYFMLWIGVPRARFLPAILNAIDLAMRHSHQPFIGILSICGIILLCIPTVAFMLIQIAMVYYFCKMRLNFKGSLLWLIGCLVGIAGIVAVMVWQTDAVEKLHRLPNMREIGFIVGVYYPGPLKMLMFALIMFTASSIGCLVALRIKDKNLLLPVVLFAASMDFWTVTVGPVSSVMKHAPEIVKAVSTPIPQAGTGTFMPQVMMGMGDPLFMAVVFAAVFSHKLNAKRNYWFVSIMMTIAMLAVLMNLLPYLPALVVLAIAVIAANWREFKLSRQEKISTAIVAIVLAATVPLVWYILKPSNTPHKRNIAPIAAHNKLHP